MKARVLQSRLERITRNIEEDQFRRFEAAVRRLVNLANTRTPRNTASGSSWWLTYGLPRHNVRQVIQIFRNVIERNGEEAREGFTQLAWLYFRCRKPVRADGSERDQ